MKSIQRRYDIDWLRVIAIGLLLIYHNVIGFQPWGVLIGFIQNGEPIERIWIPMSMLNVWRIPLLFFVSGMGVAFAIKKRNWIQLIIERTKRILVPFIFGMLAIVPIHIFILQKYYEQDLYYYPNPGHLWFLGNIFIYVLVLSPIFFFLKKHEDSTVNTWIKKVFSKPLGLLIIIAFMVMEVLIMQPQIFELYVMTAHGFILGMLAFLFGFIGVYSGDGFWNLLRKGRWFFLASAVILFVIRWWIFELKSPGYLMSIESNLWIFAVFGFANKHLNKPSNSLRYLSEAAYPIYIVHMIFLYLGSMWIFPMEMAAELKLILSLAFTGLGCFISYHFIIRKISFLRPLFGLKVKKAPKVSLAFSEANKATC